MSIIVDHDGVLKLYIKGADTTILPRLDKNNNPFLEYINTTAESMSKKGLRSLYYAMRILPEDTRGNIPIENP